MKRLFISISTTLISLFLITVIFNNKMQLQFSSYDAVDIIGTNPNGTVAKRDVFTEELNKLANETNSLIARRITEPNKDGKTRFTYEIYGEGKTPDSLIVSSKESAETSDLVSNYLIISGNLAQETLLSKINELGYSAVAFQSYSVARSLLFISASEVSFISLVLFFLTFTCLTLIYRIKDLKIAGIKMISGHSIFSIMWSAFISDGKIILLTYLFNLCLGVIGLLLFGIFQLLTVLIFLLGLTLYSLLLGMISLSLGLVYIIGLKADGLVGLLKGRLPLKRLLVIMLVGQMLSVLVVGWTANSLIKQYQDMVTKEQAAKEWDKNSDYFKVSFGFGSTLAKGEELEKQNKAWYAFVDASIREEGAIFVKNNVEKYLLSPVSDGNRLSDYVPTGNTIYVSPNYLSIQNVEVDNAFLRKMANLKQGEFGLILPEKLESQKEYYEKMYSDEMLSFASASLEADSEKLFNVTPYTTTVKNDQKRFLYNTGRNVSLQYLEDPIIIVTTPTAMGNTPVSQLFYGSEVGNALHSKGYKSTINLLKEHDTYQFTSYVLNSRLSYYTYLNESRSTFIFLVTGTILGFFTSILLFDTMNLLYFEQFRREIFIKRLSGMKFYENHFSQIISQIVTIGLGLSVLIYITKNIPLSIGTTIVFLINAMLILYKQNLSENKTAITVLKGK